MAMVPASSCRELPGSRTDVRRGIRRLRALICMGKATPLAASALAAKMSCTYTGICTYKVAGMVLNGSPAPMGIPFRLMTDDELIAVFEDFIAEAHGRVAERAQATPKAPAEPPDRPKAALYRRIGIQKKPIAACVFVCKQAHSAIDRFRLWAVGRATHCAATAQLGGPRHRPRAGALPDDAAEMISPFHGKNTRPACMAAGRSRLAIKTCFAGLRR
jgi:hypothetical protein